MAGSSGITFQQLRAVSTEQRFEFDDDGRFFLGVQLEIHEAGTQPNLRQRAGVEENFRQRTKQSLGGGFRLGSFLKLIQINVDRFVSGFETGIRQQRRHLDFKAVNQSAEFR